MQMHTVNVSRSERLITGSVAAAIALAGLRRGTAAGRVAAASGGALLLRAATGYCPVYDAMGINSADTRGRLGGRRGVPVDEAVTIQRPMGELYQRWRRLEELPQIMSHLVSVTETGDGRSHWVARAPGGPVEWDAEIIEDKPDSLLSWRTVEDSEVVSAGSVKFDTDGKSGTVVHVKLQYSPPGGRLGAAIAWLTGRSAAQSIRDDLRRFKALMEAGEVPATEGQPRGETSMLNYD